MKLNKLQPLATSFRLSQWHATFLSFHGFAVFAASRQSERWPEQPRGKNLAGWVVAHDPFRGRCPRAAPNPFFAHYASGLRASMGHRSHSTEYAGRGTSALAVPRSGYNLCS